MISAKEAKEIVTKGNNERAVRQMEMIEAETNDAIKKAYSSVGFSGVIEPANKWRLESLGYRVWIGSQYNESLYSVSWA